MTNLLEKHYPEKLKTLDLTGAQNLVKEIEIALRQKPHSHWAFGKLSAIAYNSPHWLILKEVKDDIRDNFSAVANIIGTDLTHRIQIF